MQKQLSVVGALTLYLLKEHRSPIVTLYDIGVATLRLYSVREYAGQKIKNIRSAIPRRDNIAKYRNELMENGILEERKDFPKDCYFLASSPFTESMDLACGIDPFCYVSHLSAMEYHGLTDRFAKTLFLTSPPAPIWKSRAHEKMLKDLGESSIEQYVEAGFPSLTRHPLKSLNKTSVSVLVTKFADQGAYVVPQERPVKIASIGRTFLDMLRKPDLCGGMSHVIDVFEEQAKSYLQLIINEVDRHGDPIEKVRAGYILEERCGIAGNSKINAWAAFAQRGGSRVLDPMTPYWPTFSEKWCLSINVSN